MALHTRFLRLVFLLVVLPGICMLPGWGQAGVVSEMTELDRLAVGLRDPSLEVRLRTIVRLGETQNPRPTMLLLPLLKDPESRVRAATADALHNLYDSLAVKPLLDALTDADPFVRNHVARALGIIRNRTAVQPLLKLYMTENEPQVRAGALLGLGGTCDPLVIDTLLAGIMEKNPLIRAAAARAMSHVSESYNWAEKPVDPNGDPKELAELAEALRQQTQYDHVVAELRASLKDNDAGVRISAASALLRFSDRSGAAFFPAGLQHPDPDIRQAALEGLGYFVPDGAVVPKSVDAILAFLDREKMPALRRMGIKLLAHVHDPRVAGKMFPLLHDPDADIRAAAVQVLGSIGGDGVLGALSTAVKDPDKEVRRFAISGLGELGDIRAVPALIALRDNIDADLRYTVITSLGQMGDTRALDALLAIKNLGPEERVSWILALQKFDDPRIVPPMLEALKSNDAHIKQQALQTLQQLPLKGNPDYVAPLVALMKDPDAYVRHTAVGLLQDLADDPRAAEALIVALQDADGHVRRYALQGLMYSQRVSDPRVRQALTDALKDSDDAVRRIALQGLAYARDRHAEETVRGIAVNDPDAATRAMAIRCLMGMADDQAALLAEWLKHPDSALRQAAISGLRTEKNPQLMNPLLAALQDTDARVRQAAVDRLLQYYDWRAQEPLPAVLRKTRTASWDISGLPVGKDLRLLPNERLTQALLPLLYDPDPQVRRRVMAGLLFSNMPAVNDALYAARNDGNEAVRDIALRGLARRNDTRVLNQLLNAAIKTDDEMAYAMQSLLAYYDQPRVAQALLALYKGQLKAEEFNQLAVIPDPRSDFPYGMMQSNNASLGALTSIGDSARKPLLALLADEWPMLRTSAAVVLVRIGDCRNVPALLKALPVKNPLQRWMVVRALRAASDPRAVPGLLKVLQDKDETLRAEAVLALGAIADRRAVAPLKSMLATARPELQLVIVQALGNISDPRPLAALQRLAQSPYVELRVEAVRALGKIGDARATPLLIAALADIEPDVRACAASALAHTRDPRALEPLLALAEMTRVTGVRHVAQRSRHGDSGPSSALECDYRKLGMPDGPVRENAYANAVQALVNQQDIRVVQLLFNEAPVPISGMRPEDAVVLLARRPIRTTAIDPMLKSLQDADAEKRRVAAVFFLNLAQPNPARGNQEENDPLPGMKEPRAVPLLLGLLNDPDATVREAAVSALAVDGDAQAVDPLLAMLKDAGAERRKTAAFLLGQIGAKRAAGALATLLKDVDAGVRWQAAESLAILRDARAYVPLTALLVDRGPHDEVQYARSITALGLLGDRRALETLSALPTKEDEVNHCVLLALWRIDDPKATAMLLKRLQDTPAGHRATTLYTLLRMVKMMDAYHQPIALPGKLNDPRVQALLQDALRLEMFPPVFRRGEANSEADLPALAAWALGKSGDPQAAEPLTAALGYGNPTFRHAVTAALRDLGKK